MGVDEARRDDAVGGDAEIGSTSCGARPVDHTAVAKDELDRGGGPPPRYLTMRTLQAASWLTFFDTLPRRAASSSPAPRDPTTTRSILWSFA